MKYVRVYEGDYVEDEYLTTYQEHCEHVANIQDNGFDFEGCIIKQSDTLEELFDEVVMVRNDEEIKPQLFRDWDKDDFSSFEKRLKTTNTQICGSIWVINSHNVPTLKPVAKMKSVLPNGEIDWELL